MATKDALKNVNLFVDGRGKAGTIDEVSLPDLSLIIEDKRSGGLDSPLALDMGMEGLETSFVLSAYDPDVLALWGFAQGGRIPLIVRGALESYDGTVRAARIEMRGKITTLSRGTWTPGTVPALTVTMRLDRYRELHDEREIHLIDVLNMVRVVDGVDRLLEQRRALGLN